MALVSPALVLLSLVLFTPPGPWQWPLSPVPEVLRGFDLPSSPWGPGHRGVDLAATPGQAVHAAAAGQVSFAGRVAGHGVVAVTHGALRTTYLPVIPFVRVGQYLPAGARLGIVQDLPGHCGPLHCLHWGLRRDLHYLDPLPLLRPRVRLLPHWAPQHRFHPGSVMPGLIPRVSIRPPRGSPPWTAGP